jgi:hypothetical protein
MHLLRGREFWSGACHLRETRVLHSRSLVGPSARSMGAPERGGMPAVEAAAGGPSSAGRCAEGSWRRQNRVTAVNIGTQTTAPHPIRKYGSFTQGLVVLAMVLCWSERPRKSRGMEEGTPRPMTIERHQYTKNRRFSSNSQTIQARRDGVGCILAALARRLRRLTRCRFASEHTSSDRLDLRHALNTSKYQVSGEEQGTGKGRVEVGGTSPNLSGSPY